MVPDSLAVSSNILADRKICDRCVLLLHPTKSASVFIQIKKDNELNALGHSIRPTLAHTRRFDRLQTPSRSSTRHPVRDPMRHFMYNYIILHRAITPWLYAIDQLDSRSESTKLTLKRSQMNILQMPD